MIRHFIITALALGCTSLSALAANPQVEIKTSQGDIIVEVDADKAPKSAANFLQYVKDGYYNGTIFHRVIDDFMIQGGGFDQNLQQKPARPAIENEARNGLKNLPGTLAMARTSAPHSASSQFFINLVANTALDYPGSDGWGYAVFGKVIKGMDVVEKIGKTPTGDKLMFRDVPVTTIMIESARILEEAPADTAATDTGATKPTPKKK
ncbi:peptidyl-prolyl cis-trans isomerase [Betaproteobacteria bacterium]|nr:peptidyl-prolyl cis-trans isomerase [Betaproteobacteria bacterium]GHT97418.1 peptidyl-prolyl cis-trans isomerase [Betaproteobacteria bacterium]GHU00455.1 peptidyl-prolyl cis-trans isomerase [Betaproteobacteria bacterium]GHU06929.1 peptidyl-prolyl cis-trans isomerase [Betaproteobacteria bacterium]GHU18257.1 peptidyl-prolyl cis-trans isomerase [Betaproteobacteria bacterium]